MRGPHAAVFFALVGLTVSANAAGAQDLDTPLIVSSTLSADTVSIGDAVELKLTIALGPNRVVYFPDSLDATSGLTPLGPVEWTVEPAPGGGVLVSVSYPLLARGLGIVEVSDFTIFTASRPPNEVQQAVSPEARVGPWNRLLDARGQLDSVRRGSVPGQRLWVASVLMLEDITQGIEPRRAADVMGGDWHWPSGLLIVAFTLVLGGVLMAGARDVFGHDAGLASGDDRPSISPRLAALEALDTLLTLGLHRDGRTDEFYRRSSDIVRRYVETFEADWGSDQTSTELMHALERWANVRAGHSLLNSMTSAERVKFGRLRPPPSDAESYWRALRNWIEHDGAFGE